MTGRGALLAAALGLLAPAAGRAHEVLHQIERNRAVAVRAYFADGEVLAYTQYEVFSPADPSIPYQKGRTDRSGWLAFVPDVPGAWRVKVVDATGHGLDLTVDARAATTPAADAPGKGTAPTSTVAFVLRPLAALAVIAVVFGLLLALYRRERTPR